MSLVPTFLLLGLLMIFPAQVSSVTYINYDLWNVRYLVSKYPEPFDIAKMNERCKVAGGYLFEINSEGEQWMLRDFLKLIGFVHNIVYTGVTDLGLEGQYYHYHTKKPMTNIVWQSGQPDNWQNKEHCTNLKEHGLNDIDCHRNARYICEIPR
ncbi:collectin-11 [Plakobranchus ocellatus]|uniref:Collectin-11 n=1 Tax=Plakobranchus ocellatus TaxID=259542 RepID=A0AAV3ZMQ4_9GAST|nr:collectin-11 [Plakobranchus ocellatus]